MAFLALTLLWLLNSGRTPKEWRNRLLSNVLLAASGLLFLVLYVQGGAEPAEVSWGAAQTS